MKTIQSCELTSTNTFEIIIFLKVSKDLLLGGLHSCLEKQGYLSNLMRVLVTKLPSIGIRDSVRNLMS